MNHIMLITGANQGIGYYMAKTWLELGNTAIVFDICCDEIDNLKKQYGDRLLTFIGDVSDNKAVQECVDLAVKKFSAIDIAVHNACLCIFKGLEDHTVTDYKKVLDVNFIGAVNMTKAVLPFMKQNKHGRICYTSSGVGVTDYINISGYAASKGAIESFARCMRLENLDSGVSFHILHPPLTNTESSAPLPVPKEFKADAKKVGAGFVKNIYQRKFIITPSLFDSLTIKMSYWYPRFTGKLLTKMTHKIK
jgi:NAD(P)-dependent dehydrogenase (short-subunit alcohol dehydrogenase family)